MKGVIFKHFETFICESFGEEIFEEILDATELRTEGPFLAPATYPDEDLVELVTTAIGKLDLELPATLHDFGVFLFPKLVQPFPGFLEGHTELKTFLLTLHDVIHLEVRKLMPEAQPPEFRFEDPGGPRLVVRYVSSRKLCPLFRGLLQGAADHFGERVDVNERECLLQGAECCRFDLAFAKARREAG